MIPADASGREVVVISVVGSHRRELQEWSVLVDKLVYALTSEKFVTFLVLLYGSSTAALHTRSHAFTITSHQVHVGFLVILKLLAVRIYL